MKYLWIYWFNKNYHLFITYYLFSKINFRGEKQLRIDFMKSISFSLQQKMHLNTLCGWSLPCMGHYWEYHPLMQK